jgi:hypothetical protein
MLLRHALHHALMPSNLGEWTSSSHESISGPPSPGGLLLMSAMLSSTCQCRVPGNQRGHGPASELHVQEPSSFEGLPLAQQLLR